MFVSQKQRRDPAAAWTTNNPVLLAGEIGLETDTGKFKFGDGVSHWTSLSYAGGSGAVSSVFGRTSAVTAQSGDYSVGQVTGAAPLASPAFSGVPTAPTASPGTNTTQIATTAFVAANGTTTLASLAAAMPYIVDSPDFHGALHNGVHDDTAAFNAAIANVYSLAVTAGTNRAEIWLSDGVYFIGGALNTTFSGRAQIPLPYPATTVEKFTLVIRSVALGAGDALAHWQQTVVQKGGCVILSNLDTAFDSGLGTASCIGGPTAEQVGGNAVFSNMYVYVDGVTFAATGENNHACLLDLQCVAEARLGRVGGTGNFTQPGFTTPTTQNLIGVRMPRVGNNDLLEIDSLSLEGFGIGLIPGEHTNIKRLTTIGVYSALYLQTGEADAINITYWSCEETKYGIDASNLGGGNGNQVILNITLWDIESGGELVAHVFDPNNALHGQAIYEYNAVGGSGTGSTITKSGGTNFYVSNLYTGGGLAGPAWQFRPETYGAKGDARMVADGAMTSGSAVLTCATTTPFSAADIGKTIHVGGAGGAVLTPLITTIASFQSASQVTLSASATSTVTTSIVAWATDDTAAVKSALAAAYAYATSSGLLHGEVLFTKVYGIAGACTVGGGTLGNAQIPLPVVAPGATSDKIALTFTGVSDSAVLVHWQSGVPKMPGAALLCLRNDGTVDGTFGTAHVVGGPFSGYGNGGTNFSNMKFTMTRMSVITPYNGTIGAVDVQGVAEAAFDAGASSVMASPGGVSGGGAGAGVPSMNATSISTISNFGRFGLRMPAVNNNAVCTIGDWTVEGFSAGLGASEHTSANYMELNYCYNAIWMYDAGSIAHWVELRHIVAGECVNFLLSSSAGGTTKKIKIDLASMESIGGSVFSDSNNTLVGEVYIGKINNTTISFTGGANLRVIDISALPGVWTGAPSAPTQNVAQQNTSGRDTTVYVTSTAAITAVAVTGDDNTSHSVFSGSLASGLLVPVDVPSYKSYTVTSSGGTLTTHWVKR